MAKLRVRQKVDRVMQFMMGLQHRQIANTLADHGFTQQDLDTGWRLVHAVVGDELNLGPPVAPAEPDALEQLDKWENLWFPIIEATLTHRFPDVAATVLLNLSQTDGPELVLSVGLLAERVIALERGGEREVAARQVLEQRGLTRETLQQVADLLERMIQIQSPRDELMPSAEQQQAAEAALWGWYLEWSAIARVAIKDGHLLRLLGYNTGRPGRRRATPDQTNVTDERSAAASERSAAADHATGERSAAASEHSAAAGERSAATGERRAAADHAAAETPVTDGVPV